MDRDELCFLLGGTDLKHGGETFSVFERDFLVELLARFEDTDFLRSQFRLADFVADVERRHRESDKLVCLAVDADEAGDCVAFGILQVDDSSEVADGFEHILVLF